MIVRVFALILAVFASTATSQSTPCRVCLPASRGGHGGQGNGVSPEPTSPGRPGDPGRGPRRPHCIWIHGELPLPPLPRGRSTSSGRYGTVPFAQTVANVTGPVIDADMLAQSHGTPVDASDLDFGHTLLYIEDVTPGCTCHTIPSIFGSIVLGGELSMRVHRQASPTSYAAIASAQHWSSSSGLTMQTITNDRIQPVVALTGQAGGGISVGGNGASLSVGGQPYVLSPPPMTIAASDNCNGSAPGAGRDTVLVTGHVSARCGLRFATPPGGTSFLSEAAGMINQYSALWQYMYYCPVCNTSGSSEFHWTD